MSLSVFLCIPTVLSAATLSITPSQDSFKIGQTFTKTIRVSSSDQSINAVSAVISFPKDLVTLVSVSKNFSVIKIWADEPSFSNDSGTVSFEGIILSPGFQGSSGTVLTLTFKVKAVGEGSTSFSSASVLANDGNGTNVLTGTDDSTFQIVAAKIEPKITTDKEIIDFKGSDSLEETPLQTQATTTSLEPALFDVVSSPVVVNSSKKSILPDQIILLKKIFQNSYVVFGLIAFIFLIIGYISRGMMLQQVYKTKRLKNIENEVQHTFTLLKADLLEQLHLLERAKTKRELTIEEKNLSRVIEDHLVDAEKYIIKKIDAKHL